MINLRTGRSKGVGVVYEPQGLIKKRVNKSSNASSKENESSLSFRDRSFLQSDRVRKGSEARLHQFRYYWEVGSTDNNTRLIIF
jgi:hypothetical protein